MSESILILCLHYMHLVLELIDKQQKYEPLIATNMRRAQNILYPIEENLALKILKNLLRVFGRKTL